MAWIPGLVNAIFTCDKVWDILMATHITANVRIGALLIGLVIFILW